MTRPMTIGRHPVHPMLVVFPIGLWSFSFMCDFIFLLDGGSEIWSDMALFTMIGGIIGALLAAVPGLIDFFSIANGEVKKIARRHMSMNLVIVAMFGLNLWLRTGDSPYIASTISLSAVGITLLSFSGWLGSQLIQVYGMAVQYQKSAEEESGVQGGQIKQIA